jgi:hypothetical protein
MWIPCSGIKFKFDFGKGRAFRDKTCDLVVELVIGWLRKKKE